MAIRITTIDDFDKKKEHFYKRVSKEICNTVRGRRVSTCRVDVDIESIEDINRVRYFLDNLEASMKSPKQQTEFID